MTHIQQRRDQASVWTSTNPVLFDGEAGHESDTGKWKLGDGVTAWNALPYKSGVDSVAGKTGAVSLDIDDVAGAAPLASPTLTGTPTGTTAATSDDSTRLATTAWVKNQEYAALDSPALTGTPTAPTPATGDDDTSIATTEWVKNQEYAPLASPTLTGDPKAPTPVTADSDTSIATTAFVYAAIAAARAALETDVPCSVDPNVVAVVNRAYRRGGMVTVYGEVTLEIGWNTTWAIFNVPLGYRPIVREQSVFANEASGTNSTLRVNTNGDIIVPYESVAAGATFRFHFTYPRAV